jgi:hypothetical protein
MRVKEAQRLLFVCLAAWGAVCLLAWLTIGWLTELLAGVPQ